MYQLYIVVKHIAPQSPGIKQYMSIIITLQFLRAKNLYTVKLQSSPG